MNYAVVVLICLKVLGGAATCDEKIAQSVIRAGTVTSYGECLHVGQVTGIRYEPDRKLHEIKVRCTTRQQTADAF